MSGWGSYSLRCCVSCSHTCGFREAGLRRIAAGGRTQSALIYFRHLLWFLQQSPEHSWSRAWCWAVCAWNQLCQHSRVSVRSGGFLWQNAFPGFTTTLSCSRNDTSPTTSSILVNMDSNMVMLTLPASFCQSTDTFNTRCHVILCSVFVRMSDEGLNALCCGFLDFSFSNVLWFSQILPLSSFLKLRVRF